MKKLILVPAMALALAAPAFAQLSLNVRDADIRAFIADAAKATGRTFIIDNRVNGKVTVVTDHPLSQSQYFEIFLSTLRANGLVAVPTSGGAFRIQPTDNAASQPTPVGSRAPARDSFVTDIVRLKRIDAASALDTVKPLVSPQGSVTANNADNALVIVDFADNVRRVREVLARIDADNASMRVITLKNAGAHEIAQALQGLAGGGGQGGNANAGSNVSVVAVDSANSIVLRGDPSAVARLADVAAQLDQKAEQGTQIRVVFLENADAAQLLPVLQQLVGEQPTEPTEDNQQIGTSDFLNSNNSGNGTTTNTTQGMMPTPAPTPTPTPASTEQGNTPTKPAIVGQGGRTAAVVTRFAGANAIVIAAPPEVQRQLSDVIRQLDTRRQQVLVEAVVAEVSDTAAKKLGVQFLLGSLSGGAFAASNYSNSAPSLLTIAGAIGAQKLAGTTTTVGDGGQVVTSQDTTVTDQLAQSAVSSLLGTTGGLFGGGGQIGDTILGGIINAVKSDTQSNLLQAPSLVTLDNNPAHILVGQEIPITTGKALSADFNNAFQTTQRENVGIQLDVKPQINSSGTIKLFLHQTVSSIAGPVSSSDNDLILNKREVQTTLTVDDGQIAVIGGLLDDNEARTIERIPFLSNIPVLGNLFKSKSRSHEKTNLMIFIRPTILKTADDARIVAERRYGYLRAQQGEMNPNEEPTIDQLVRDYMGASPPLPPSPEPGNINDPTIMVPTVKSSTEVIKPAKGEEPVKIRRGDLTEEGVTPADLPELPAIPEAVLPLPYPFARRFGVVLDGEGEHLAVAMREGGDPKVLLEVRRHVGRPFDVAFVTPEAFDKLLGERYAMDGQAAAMAAGNLGLDGDLDLLATDLPTAEDLLDSADDAPAIRLINGIIADAARNGVSDIHIEPYETGLVIRMRIDGVLRETLRMPPHVAPVVVSRIKVMARLDIAERRVPQDGRIGLTLGGKLLDVRVSTLPSRAGERVVLRILDKENAGIELVELGMPPKVDRVVRGAIAEPNGIVLVTGPTGSGKTTTLYAALRLLNDGSRNILTVEDPVEYAVEGVGQTQVNPKVGLTFAAGLRAILRQDPDVVMVGEIRDRETAEIAVQASLTGHLVLSTVHTNDAIGAITRMRDMKVEPFLLASTLRAVIAQRLVRRLCPECRRAELASASVAALLGIEPGTIVYEPVGCPQCNGTGFKGRIGVFEAVRIDETIRRLINDGGDEGVIARHAFTHADNLATAARQLVRDGLTTPEEAVRVSRSDMAEVDV